MCAGDKCALSIRVSEMSKASNAATQHAIDVVKDVFFQSVDTHSQIVPKAEKAKQIMFTFIPQNPPRELEQVCFFLAPSKKQLQAAVEEKGKKTSRETRQFSDVVVTRYLPHFAVIFPPKVLT